MAAPNKCSSQQSPTISNSRKRRLSSQSSSSLSRQTPSKLMRLDQGKLIVLDPVDLSNDDTNLSKCPESGPPVYDCTESEMPECDPPAYNSSESKSAEIISLGHNISGAPSHESHTVSSSSGEVISHQNGNNDSKTVSNQFPGLPGSISRPTLMSQGHPSSTVNNWPIPVQRNSSTGRNSVPKFFSSLSKSYFPLEKSKRSMRGLPKMDTPGAKFHALHAQDNIKTNLSRSKKQNVSKVDLKPLADRMRPQVLDDFVGQDDIMGPDGMLRQILEDDSYSLPSLVLWGPPGSGKTSIANIIAKREKTRNGAVFVKMSAVSSGVAEVRKVIAEAQSRWGLLKRKTLLFLDEIHRFNKLQQDIFLPFVEDGTITLIGATTENVSFELNSALLSRAKVLVLEKLSSDAVTSVLRRALGDRERGFGALDVRVEEEVLSLISCSADGDARSALNLLEMAVKLSSSKQSRESTSSGPKSGSSGSQSTSSGPKSGSGGPQSGSDGPQSDSNTPQSGSNSSQSGSNSSLSGSSSSSCGSNSSPHESSISSSSSSSGSIQSKETAEMRSQNESAPASPVIRVRVEDVRSALQKTHLLSDKHGDQHFDLISALHKSVRGSDADAALYWLGRMLEGGQTPLYIARRLIRMASEDIGLADPQALVQATAAFQACHMLGMPECDVVLAQATAYLALAPKSIAVYAALKAVKSCIQSERTPPVPLHLRNAPTKLMRELGHGLGYRYNPDFDYNVPDQTYLPDSLSNRRFLPNLEPFYPPNR
eukprot:255270_1